MTEHVHNIIGFQFSDGVTIEKCTTLIPYEKHGEALWYDACTHGDAHRAKVLAHKVTKKQK
jgi:hypothetical protein